MLFRFLKGNQPALLLFIPVIAVLLWLKYLILPSPGSLSFDPYPMPLYALVENLLKDHNLLSKLTALSLLVINGLLLTWLNTKYMFIQGRTYLPSIFYIIIVSSFLPLQSINPAVFASLCLVFATDKMFASFKKEGLAREFFEAALLVSVASLFYAKSVYLIIIVWAALIHFRNFSWREWLFSFLGFCTPYLILFAISFIRESDIALIAEGISRNFERIRNFDGLNIYFGIFYAYLLTLILIASWKLIAKYQGLKIYVRRYLQLNFWIFITSLGMYCLLFRSSVEMIYFSAFPVSFVLTDYFIIMRSRFIRELMLFIFLGLFGMLLIFN